jgi:hypothetical protein
MHLNGISTQYLIRDFDFNGDKVVDAEDKSIINKILNGINLD